MKKQPFSYHLTVPPSAIDVLGHVNNVVYLDWVQIAASKHWNAATATYFKDEGVNDIDLSILESVIPDIDSW